jgi:hypothetical protein
MRNPARHSTTLNARSRAPVQTGARVSHDGDDLGDGGRVGRIALALGARRAAGVDAGQGAGERGRPAATDV